MDQGSNSEGSKWIMGFGKRTSMLEKLVATSLAAVFVVSNVNAAGQGTDPQLERVIAMVRKSYRQIKSLSLHVLYTRKDYNVKSGQQTFWSRWDMFEKLCRPRFGRVDETIVSSKNSVPERVKEISDGQRTFTYTPTELYNYGPNSENKLHNPLPWMRGAGYLLYRPEMFGYQDPKFGKISYLGTETWRGKACELVRITSNTFMAVEETYFVDHKGIVVRVLCTQGSEKSKRITDEEVLDYAVNPTFTSSTFKLTRLSHLKYWDVVAENKALYDTQGYLQGKTLLPIGAAAPDFTLLDTNGNKVSLSSELKGRKAVIINFWCMGCNRGVEQPVMSRLAERLASKDIVVLSLERDMLPGALAKSVAELGLKQKVLQQGTSVGRKYDSKYDAAWATFIVSGDGKIVDRIWDCTTAAKLEAKMAQLTQDLKRLGVDL